VPSKLRRLSPAANEEAFILAGEAGRLWPAEQGRQLIKAHRDSREVLDHQAEKLKGKAR